MDIQALRKAIQESIDDDKTLTVTEGTLDDADNINSLLDKYFPNSTLTIRNATVDTDDFVRVTGVVNNNELFPVEGGSAQFQAEAKFYIVDSKAELQLVSTAPEGWKFEDSFPSLADSYFNQFGLGYSTSNNIPPTFTANSVDNDSEKKGKKGLIYHSGFGPPSIWEVMKWLLALDPNPTMSGPLEFDRGCPVMTLTVEPKINATVQGNGFELFLTNYSKTFTNERDPNNPAFVAFSQLTANLEFSHQGKQVTIPISTQFSTDLSVLNFRMDTAGAFDLFLSDIKSWVGGVDLKSALPSGYKALGLTLNDVDFAIGLRTTVLEYVDLEVKSQTPWEIVKDLIIIEAISIGFMVTDTLSKPETMATLYGLVSIAGVEIDTHSRYPNFTIEGQLNEEKPKPNLAPLIAKLLGSTNGVPKELVIEKLYFRAYPEGGEYAFGIDTADKWEIITNLYLTGVQLAIAYESEQISGGIQAFFTILDGVSKKELDKNTLEPFDVTISGEYGNTSDGWTLSGKTGEGQQIPIGLLIEDLASKFGDVTLPEVLTGLTINNIAITFHTTSKDFSFSEEAELPLDGQPVSSSEAIVDIIVDIELTQNDANYTKKFGGVLKVNDLQFNLIFSKDNSANYFIASYQDLGQGEVSIHDLVASVSESLADVVPEGMSFKLKDALFAYLKPESNNPKYLFGFDMDVGINLSNLPLVGKLFPNQQSLRLVFEPLVASAEFAKTEVESLRPLIPSGGTPLPDDEVGEGLSLSITMRLGDKVVNLDLPVTIDASSGELVDNSSDETAGRGGMSATDDSATDDTKWFQIQKSFGPVHFERIGVLYHKGNLSFLLDASLSFASLAIALEGLSASSPLNVFSPTFSLQGLSIDYKSKDIEIGGAFLQERITPAKGEPYDEYSGAALIKAEELNLSAIGSYAYLNGQPSLFIYGVLDYPLGGPPFLFVIGLVGSFGYNRNLRIPSIDEVAQFPLVEEAVNNTGNPNNLAAELEKLSPYISPAVGEYFLAFGIRFTTFELVDSFALVTVSIGNRFELDIIGLSTATVPPPEEGKSVSPIAEVQMALKFSFIPDEGFLGVRAQLTSESFFLSKNCHLTGGFALYCWFSGEHAGDFVNTVGGYHPNFQVPSHYPQVPRLGFNWRVDSHATFKGDTYFALCAHAFMVGGHLDITFQSGALKAWFKAGADFLIAWKPYHYEALIYVNVGASCTFHVFGTHYITVSVGANLHLWGPEFGGKVSIKMWIFTIPICFGASYSQSLPQISWDTFKDSFLPEDSQVCTITVKDGLVRKVGQDESDLGVINPKHFSLVVDAIVPSKKAYKQEVSNDNELDSGGANTDFGIASMDVQSSDLTTKQIVSITKDGTHVEDEFEYIPIKKQVPAGLWGTSPTPKLNGEKFIENALSGFEIKPGNPPKPGQTYAVDRSNLKFEPEDAPAGYRWEPQTPFNPSKLEDEKRRDSISNTLLQNSNRNSLLENMGFDPNQDVDLNTEVADDFLVAPQVKA